MRYFNGHITKITPFDTIYIHECHKDWFLKQFKLDNDTGIYHPYGLKGFNIYFVDNIPKWRTKWIFPNDPFVEYSESDEQWARQIRYGKEVETKEPAIYCANMKMYYDQYSPFKLLLNKDIVLTC